MMLMLEVLFLLLLLLVLLSERAEGSGGRERRRRSRRRSKRASFYRRRLRHRRLRSHWPVSTRPAVLKRSNTPEVLRGVSMHGCGRDWEGSKHMHALKFTFNLSCLSLLSSRNNTWRHLYTCFTQVAPFSDFCSPSRRRQMPVMFCKMACGAASAVWRCSGDERASSAT